MISLLYGLNGLEFMLIMLCWFGASLCIAGLLLTIRDAILTNINNKNKSAEEIQIERLNREDK